MYTLLTHLYVWHWLESAWSLVGSATVVFGGSFVKTETNCSFKMFALLCLSLVMNTSLFFRSGMPISSCPKLLT